MRSKVKFSAYSIITTVIVLGVLVACCFIIEDPFTFYVVLTITLLLVIFAGLYGPLSIDADSSRVRVKSILRNHKIPMRQVAAVELFQPTLGAYRLFGSGGFLGYWGLFREGDIGKYTAYYGKASDCFLIRLKNGDKYVLGCENPEKMVDYINSRVISQ